MQILPIHLSSIGGGSSSQGQETAVNAVRIFFHHVDHLSPSLQPVKELKRPVGHMVCVDRSVVVVLSVAVVIFPAPNTKMSEKFSPRRFQLLERAMELFLCYKSDPVLRVQQSGGAQLHSEEVGRIMSEMDPVSREFGGSDATVARPKKKKPMAVQVFNCFLVIRFFSFVILLWISNRTKLAIIENENYLIDVVSWPTCAASLRNPPRPACGPFTWAKENQRPSLSSYLLDRPGLLPLPKENNLPNSSRNCSCCSCTRPVNRWVWWASWRPKGRARSSWASTDRSPTAVCGRLQFCWDNAGPGGRDFDEDEPHGPSGSDQTGGHVPQTGHFAQQPIVARSALSLNKTDNHSAQQQQRKRPLPSAQQQPQVFQWRFVDWDRPAAARCCPSNEFQ